MSGSISVKATPRSLRKWAYSRLDFERMVQATPFGRCEIAEQPLGFEVELLK
jgi:hypothetical protein